MRKHSIIRSLLILCVITLLITTFYKEHNQVNQLRASSSTGDFDAQINKTYSIEEPPNYPDRQKFLDKEVKKINKRNEDLDLEDYTVLIGDSITHKLLEHEDLVPENSVNLGINGATSYDIASNIDQLYFTLDTSEIKNVYITLGVNDTMISKEYPDYTPSMTVNYINYIIDRINKDNPDTNIYVISTLPSAEGSYRGKFENNAFVDELVPVELLELDRNARFININSKLKNKQGYLIESYTVDGLHLSEEGYFTALGLIREEVQNDKYLLNTTW